MESIDWEIDYDDPDDGDEDEEFDCGEGDDGQCRYSGSEHCDFSCPYHDEVFRLVSHTEEPQP